jgi:dinuclear metal center YbgI/SA1388 family protein
MPAPLDEIVSYLNTLLDIEKIKDSSCNGLQVQGVKEVRRVGCAVDACMAVYRKAAAKNCQMLVVHHGLIWTGLTSISGTTRDQVQFLIKNGINLYTAHLPLDLHPVLGNNIMLAKALNLSEVKPFGKYHGNSIGFQGILPKPCTIAELGSACNKKLGAGTEKCSMLAFGKAKIRTVAIVSGGGSDAIPEAIDKKLDCFITGEPNHWNHHTALEGGLNVLYLGHYRSETPGVKAVGEDLKRKFDVETVFIDEPTLV